ncbi:MAG: hypothetical protein IJA15_03765 [Clostridia bacterium]|nr:hypothetical protein [Clostridia bacterium]
MKKIKSLLVLLLTALTCLSSACTGQDTVTTNLFAGSYWSTETSANLAPINEVCVYNVTFEEADLGEGKARLKVESFTGTLTTTFTRTAYNGTPCYKFETAFSATGQYSYKDTKSEIFTDSATSEVYFLGLNDKFTPLYSKKYNLSTAPVVSATSEEVKFVTMEYQVETSYNLESKKATSTFKGLEKSSEGYKLPDSEKVYDNYSKNSPLFDNESLLVVARAAGFSPEKGFSGNFFTLDAISQKIHPMRLMINSTNPTGDIELNELKIDNLPATAKFSVYNAQIAINDEFSGSAIELFYAVNTDKDFRRLIKIKKELAYSAGYITYTLASVTTK